MCVCVCVCVCVCGGGGGFLSFFFFFFFPPTPPKVPRAATQQDMGHKMLFYKRMGLLFLLKCGITL